MKRPINKFWIILLAVATGVAVCLSVMTYFSTTSAVMPNIAGILASPFRSASAAVSGTVGHWSDYLTEFDTLKAENEELKLRIAEMEENVRQAVAEREENIRLRSLLDLREQRRELKFESARIVVQDASNWSSMLTINKGTMHGVAVGNCVINETGHLIGVITETGLNWSTVRTILDSESSIGALVFRSGASAVAQGDFALMHNGCLSLGYLGTDPDLVSGDLVVTSGLGGYYPSQLVIGYVEEVRPGDDGMSQVAVVRPDVDMSALTQVFVITDFDISD